MSKLFKRTRKDCGYIVRDQNNAINYQGGLFTLNNQ